MRNMKKFVALALATTMVLGNSLTAFAEETNTGNSTGAGTSEGHVDKKATNVVLPTEVDNSTFAYTMDPERLIAETSHGKYGNAVEFPASNNDTGVYFNNGPKGGDGDDKNNVVYANTSKALDVVNKSSHSIDLTVKAEAVAGDNDIPLVAQSDIADAKAASLYLGLKVGSAAAETVLADTAATKTVSIAGTVGNFKTAVKTVGGDKSYEYRALTLDEYQALDGNSKKTQADYDATWAKTSFNLEGEVTEDLQITSSTTAPSVKVTWSWVDPSAGPTVTMTTSGLITVTNAPCTSSQLKAVVGESGAESYSLINNNAIFSDPSSGTITIQMGDAWLNAWASHDDVRVVITFNDDTIVTSNAVTFAG